jgi:hypothetical protein
MTTSSDNEDERIGRRVSRILDYSSDDEPKPKQQQPKEKKPKKQPKPPPEPKPVRRNERMLKAIPPAPPPQPNARLTKVRRQQIIDNFELGKEDPEYSVVKKADGGFRVSKRKSFFTPTANIDTSSPKKPPADVHMTWMNLQTQMNESLTHDVRKLRKKYEKLADKYEAGHTQSHTHKEPEPEPTSSTPADAPPPIPPPPPKPLPASPVPVPASQIPTTRRPPARRVPRFTYTKTRPMNIRDF